MRRLLTAAPFLLLAACGLNGTDTDNDDDAAAPAAAQAASDDPDFAEFEAVEIADSQPRPEMRLQVVLDRLGFGPGVVDGRPGLSTDNALKGFQEANGLEVTGELDTATREALARWDNVAATKVVRIPASWGDIRYRATPEEPEDQAKLDRLGYENLDEKLAERFHTTPEVLRQLNQGGRPAGSPVQNEADAPRPQATPTPSSADGGEAPEPALFRPGQLVRVPNIGPGTIQAATDDDQDWRRTLASLGVAADQPEAARVVVDKSEGVLRAFDDQDQLIALFTVTSGSQHDPLPIGEWKVLGVAHNPPFAYDPELFWDVPDDEEKQQLPPGPNGPVGVAWIDLSKGHYGIHGTPEPQTIGRAQSHGCVRLTNWDVARLAGMVSGSTEVIFQA